MKKKRPLASISLDLDNKWSYLKTHGDEEWESMPSYFDYIVPRILRFLEDHGLLITFFVVGQDAALEKNHEAIASIANAGHEIANHSFNHEPWLHLYTPSQLDQEFEKSESAIRQITGQQTVGFRGPGFSLSDEVLRTLVRRGYEYDCSTFPTYLGPVARAYYFFKSSLSSAQKEERKELFGSWKDGLQSNQPFSWDVGNTQLLEIPVTTMPIFKVPIHASYIMYLASFSKVLAKSYFWSAIQICRAARVQPSFLLHPLDFMSDQDDADMGFFPGMNQPSVKKIELLSDCLDMLGKHFDLVTMREHAHSLEYAKMKIKDIETAPLGVRELADAQA
ncbi:MAG: polysaccharide deacetylase family protein [Mariniblastus sp.]